MRVIDMHIQDSEGNKFQIAAPLTKDFWKQSQISEKQFIDMADTFDILLFTCNTAGGKVIRTYSGSEYDHAAMVLKFGAEPQEVFFMEATGNIGVGLKRFSGMKQALGSFYKKIVIRHLEWERPDGALEKLEQFVNEV